MFSQVKKKAADKNMREGELTEKLLDLRFFQSLRDFRKYRGCQLKII